MSRVGDDWHNKSPLKVSDIERGQFGKLQTSGVSWTWRDYFQAFTGLFGEGVGEDLG